ncbi:MAG: hypothetical protein ACI4MN_04315 [Candidatus Coproplasma sp.]
MIIPKKLEPQKNTSVGFHSQRFFIKKDKNSPNPLLITMQKFNRTAKFTALYAQIVMNKSVVDNNKKTRVCKSYQQNAENTTKITRFRSLKINKC